MDVADDDRATRAASIRDRARRAAAMQVTNAHDADDNDYDDDDGAAYGAYVPVTTTRSREDDDEDKEARMMTTTTTTTTTSVEVTRAVLEALTAMQDTQVRMNSKLAWIARSLPKVYDAVMHDCATAIEANGEKIDKVGAQIGALAVAATTARMRTVTTSESGGGGYNSEADARPPPPTTTTMRRDGRTLSAHNSVPNSRSQSPTRARGGSGGGLTRGASRRRVAFGEVESHNEYVKNLPKIGHISDASELSANDARDALPQQRAGYGPTAMKHVKKKAVKLEDPRKWTREKWLQHLRAHAATLFGNLDDLSIGDMVDSAKCLFVQRGARVVTQGEQGDTMYVVVLGKMHVVVTSPGVNRGESLQVATLLQGDFFGEIALMTGEVRRATVMAPYEGDGNVWVLEFSKREIGSVMLARQDILRALTDVCANRKLDSLV